MNRPLPIQRTGKRPSISRERGFKVCPPRKASLNTLACAPESDLSRTIPTGFLDDGINELLRLAGVSTEDAAARRWLESALVAARSSIDPRRVSRPSPAKHNAQLEKIERASKRLITTLEQLRRHPHAHQSFWSFAAFGPVYDSKFERAGVMPTLTTVREAARKGRVSKTGRPRNVRKQEVVESKAYRG